jgi:uncharacterized protein (TIGR00290 family)
MEILWMKAAGLFSGGKDSLYAVYHSEEQGVEVEYLVSLIPSFSRPSPHAENIEALKLLVEAMNRSHIIVDLHKGSGKLIDTLKNLKVDALVARDLLIEDHVSWLEEICGRAGITLLEPLYGRRTLDIFHEIFSSGFKATIIGVDVRYIGEGWLGFTISKENAHMFLSKNGQIDPLGENGEYHTIVIGSPLYPKIFKIKSARKLIAKDLRYLHIELSSCERKRGGH